MKREDLRAIEGLTEEQINQIMRLHGQDETAHQATVQGLQAQLTTAQKGLAAFEGVDVNDLRNQITDLTNQLTTQAAEYTFSGVLRTAAREANAAATGCFGWSFVVSGMKKSPLSGGDLLQCSVSRALCIYCSAGARRFMGSCGEAAQISRNSALHQRNSSIWQSLHRFVLR